LQNQGLSANIKNRRSHYNVTVKLL